MKEHTPPHALPASSQGRSRGPSRAVTRCLVTAIAVVLGAVLMSAPGMSTAHAVPAGQAPPACAEPSGPPQPLKATTIETIEQAYRCILDNFIGGEADNRALLHAAFSGLTRELHRLGRDVADATMPPLTGDRSRDWTAFATTYTQVTGRFSGGQLRQALAAASLSTMVAALRNNHAGWERAEMPADPEPGTEYGLGIVTTPTMPSLLAAPEQATPPLHVASLRGGPAATKGLRPGDIIEAVNGAPPFVGGILSAGAVAPLFRGYPDDTPVRLTLRRPSTGRTWTVSLTPGVYKPDPKTTAQVTSSVKGHIGYVGFTAFGPKIAEEVLKAIKQMREVKKLRGLVLDVRGNTGGSTGEVNRLLTAFAHNKVTAYHCDGKGECEEDRTRDDIELLGLPLVVLTDRDCGSACDHFAAAVKDLKLGTLIGTRTAGIIGGRSRPFLLNDNSALLLPDRHHLGPAREVVNGIGVAPDHYVPRTAKDLSIGKDPGLGRALTLLR